MTKRLITSGIGLIVFFALFFMNENIFMAAIAVVSVAMTFEALRAIKPGKTVTIAFVIYSILYSVNLLCSIISDKLFNYQNPNSFKGLLMEYFADNSVMLIIGILLTLILSIRFFNKVKSEKIYSSFFVTLYLTLFMSFISLSRVYVGRYAVLLTFLFSWITDTGAYFTGMAIGKHKLSPKLSPKKTVEGAIGGAVFTAIGTVVFIWVMRHFYSVQFSNSIALVTLSLVGAGMSELGDLAASALKRECGVKDFGKIFPGHGGFLDRFDSVVFVAPFVFFLMYLCG